MSASLCLLDLWAKFRMLRRMFHPAAPVVKRPVLIIKKDIKLSKFVVKLNKYLNFKAT